MHKLIVLRKKNFLLAGIISLLLIMYFNLKPSVQSVFNSHKLLPIYCVDRDDNKISLSFDAAWGADDTDKLLEILNNNDVRATFFLCGYWIDKYPDEVKKIISYGHDVGNHGNTHAHGNKLSLEQNKQEILRAHKKIQALFDEQEQDLKINLFRPPFGEYNDTVIQAAQELNYYPIQWDVDSLDWKELGAEHELNHVLNHKKLKSGSIILFHNDAKYTPKILDKIIKGLKEKNYELVPISELIYKENYKINHEGRQILNDK